MSTLKLKTPAGGSISLTPTDTASDVTLTLPASTTSLVDSATLAASGGSALVGYLPEGTGAVATTVQGKLREIVSPADFADGVPAGTSSAYSMKFYSGQFPISSTITFPSSGAYGGGRWQGAGSEWSTAFSSRSQNALSRLRWDGSVGGTMLNLDGQLGMTFADLSFVGKSSAGALNQAGVLNQWSMSGSAGSGESIYLNCTWQYYDIAVRMGTSVGDGTCAGLQFVKCSTQNGSTFLQVENSQGLNYVLDHFSANFVDRVAYLKRGGNLQVRGGNFAGCGATNWIFELSNLGTSIYANSFRDVRIEQNSKRVLKSVGGCVIIEGMTEAQTNQAVTMFDFAGTKAIIRDSRLITRDATNPTITLTNQSGGFVGSLMCECVHFDATVFTVSEWVQRTNQNVHSIVTFVGCTYGANETPIADFSTDAAHGTVPLSGQTTGAATGTLTIFGLNRNHYSVCKIPNNYVVGYEVDIVAKDDLGAVAFQGKRMAVAKNAAGVCTLANSTVVGTDYNPLSIGTAPSVFVSDGFDSIEVSVTGSSGRTLNWAAGIREASRVVL